jgi:ABC-type Fe3+-hydroxamate transport system substrate-binding protein
MKLSPTQVVVIIVALAVAVILGPVTVMAATGQLVNITDPADSSRKARVGSTGTLQVESRAGSVNGAWNTFFATITDVTPRVVFETGNPNRIAVTEWTVTVMGDNSASTNHVRLIEKIRTSGTASCSDGTGWSPATVLRTMSVHAGDTVQLLYAGPSLVLTKPAAGQHVCLLVQQTKWTGSTGTDIGVTGYKF